MQWRDIFEQHNVMKSQTSILFLSLTLFLAACSSKSESTKAPQAIEPEKVSPAGLQLIQSNDCQACHHVKNTLVGPSYTAIAAKYDESDTTIAMLSEKVIKGGSGIWGDASMNAHAMLSEEDAREMVTYILFIDSSKQ